MRWSLARLRLGLAVANESLAAISRNLERAQVSILSRLLRRPAAWPLIGSLGAGLDRVQRLAAAVGHASVRGLAALALSSCDAGLYWIEQRGREARTETQNR